MTERQYMKMDILEDMRERIGCDYIPDLLFRQWDVCRALKTFPLYQYSYVAPSVFNATTSILALFVVSSVTFISCILGPVSSP